MLHIFTKQCTENGNVSANFYQLLNIICQFDSETESLQSDWVPLFDLLNNVFIFNKKEGKTTQLLLFTITVIIIGLFYELEVNRGF